MWQFRIRDLMLLTAFCAGVSLAIVWRGPAVLLVAAGLAVTGLTALAKIKGSAETPRRWRRWLPVWGLMAISLFLPSVRGCSTTLSGWQAASAAVQFELSLIAELNKRQAFWPELNRSIFILTFVNLANLCFLLTPLAVWKADHKLGRRLAVCHACSVVAVWVTPVADIASYYLGYYCWAVSHTWAAVLLPWPKHLWWVMLVLAALLLIPTQ